MSREKLAGGKIIPPEETALFCRQIAAMLHAGILLEDGVDVLREAYKNSKEAERFESLSQSVRKNGSLYEAVSESGLFPDYMTQMVRIGEKTGTLEESMRDLAVFYENEAQIRQDIKNAIAYPLVLIGMMLALLALLVVHVFPIFSGIIESLPKSFLSQTTVRFGTTLGVIALSVCGAVLLISLLLLALLHTGLRPKMLKVLRRMAPMLKKIDTELSAARFCSVMGRMMASGYPLPEALSFAEDVAADDFSKAKLAECRRKTENDVPFPEAVEQTGMFSPLHGKMIHVGFASGQMDQTFADLASLLHRQADDEISRSTGMVEPILVALLAVILGALLLAVMLPLAGVLAAF